MAQSRIERMMKEVGSTSHGKLAALTLVAAGVAVMVTTTTLTSGDLTAAGGNMAQPLETGGGSSYFPRQYVNQATEASEHIQAF